MMKGEAEGGTLGVGITQPAAAAAAATTAAAGAVTLVVMEVSPVDWVFVLFVLPALPEPPVPLMPPAVLLLFVPHPTPPPADVNSLAFVRIHGKGIALVLIWGGSYLS